MPRTRSLAWSELKIGIVSVFALAIAAVLIFMVSGEGGFFWQRYSLKTVFNQLNDFVSSAEAVTRSINAGRGTLGRLTTNDAAARSLEQSLANLQEVTERIRNGEGS